jgi:hypothetical protein
MTILFRISSADNEYAVTYVLTAFYSLPFRNLGFYIGLLPLLSDNGQRATRIWAAHTYTTFKILILLSRQELSLELE